MSDRTPAESSALLTQAASWMVALELWVKERLPLAMHADAASEVRRIRGLLARHPEAQAEAVAAADWILDQSDRCAAELEAAKVAEYDQAQADEEATDDVQGPLRSLKLIEGGKAAS